MSQERETETQIDPCRRRHRICRQRSRAPAAVARPGGRRNGPRCGRRKRAIATSGHVACRGLVKNDPWVAPIFKDKLELRSHLNEHEIVLPRDAARLVYRIALHGMPSR